MQNLKMAQTNNGTIPLEKIVDFSLGGDWGKSPDEKLQDYIKVKVVRGTEFANWQKNKTKTAALRQIKKSSFEKRQLKKGDLVVEVSGGGPKQPVGRVVVIDDEALNSSEYPLVCSNFFRQVRIKEGYTPEFIKLSIYKDYLAGKVDDYQTSSTNLRNLNFRDFLANIEIPDIPETEQQHIADRLSTAIDDITASAERLQKTRRLIAKFRQAILSDAVTGKLTEDWRSSNPNVETAQTLLSLLEIGQIKKSKANIVNFDASELPEIPNTWTWVSFSQIGELARGKSKHRPRNDQRLFGGKYPFIQTGDVARSNGKINTYTQTYNETGLAQSRLFPRGTLCITIAANIADAGILDLDACFPDSVVGFIPFKPILTADYFYFFITTAKNNLEQFAPETAQKNINLGILNELAVPLPPLEEMTEITNRVNNYLKIAEGVEKQIEKAEARVSRLTQAILAKTFRQE